MTHRHSIRILIVCAAAAGLALPALPVLAIDSAANSATAQSADSKPLNLSQHRRKPVATSATRTVKKKNGEYAKVTVKRRAKQQAAAQTPVEPLSPAAAQAYASYELARVRVVTPETTGAAALLASSTAAIVGIDSIQVVSPEQVNDIDRQADSSSAVSLDALSRDLAGSGQHDFAAVAEAAPSASSESWLQRVWSMLGGAFTAFAALVRSLIA